MIYLDNATTSWPKPESVYQAMDEFLRKNGGNPGRGSHSMALAAGEVVEETRMLVARLINAPEKDRVIFTLNCTDALNLGLKGVLKPDDHVITNCIGYNEHLSIRYYSVKSGILQCRGGDRSNTSGLREAYENNQY